MARTANFDRQTALEKAVKLFWSRGYHASSMKHIEQALDMRPGSLYAAFGSKSGLFNEALEMYTCEAQNKFETALKQSDTVLGGIKAYLMSFAQPCFMSGPEPCSDSGPESELNARHHTFEGGASACMVIKTLLELNQEDQSLRDNVNQILDKVESGLQAVLALAQVRGEIRAEVDCSRLARLLQAQMIGLRAFNERDTSPENRLDLAEDIASMLDVYAA